MVVLAFGLMAVTNLMLVAASSNTVANHSTAAATSAAEAMDMIRGTSWPILVAGGDHTDDDETGAIDCSLANANTYRCVENIRGRRTGLHPVGRCPRAGNGALVPHPGALRGKGRPRRAPARAREFTTFRSCTSAACPAGSVMGIQGARKQMDRGLSERRSNEMKSGRGRAKAGSAWSRCWWPWWSPSS